MCIWVVDIPKVRACVTQVLPNACDTAEDITHAHFETVVADGVECIANSAESAALVVKKLQVGVQAWRGGVGSVVAGADVLDHRLAVGTSGMEIQTEVTETGLVESSLHDFQGGALLGHEQNLLSCRDGNCDEVRDRLRLAGTWRPLDHEVTTSNHL